MYVKNLKKKNGWHPSERQVREFKNYAGCLEDRKGQWQWETYTECSLFDRSKEKSVDSLEKKKTKLEIIPESLMNTLKVSRISFNTCFFFFWIKYQKYTVREKKNLKIKRTKGAMRTKQTTWVVGLTAEFLPISEDLKWGQIKGWEAAEKFNSVLFGIDLCCTG